MSPQDKALLGEAREAFRNDYRYLLEILWQARSRLPQVDQAQAVGLTADIG